MLGIEPVKITRISLLDGTSGISRTITDPQQIKEFMDLFDGAYLLKYPSQAQTSGFITSVVLYSDKMPPNSSSFIFEFLIVQTNGERYISSRYFDNNELGEIRKKYGLTR